MHCQNQIHIKKTDYLLRICVICTLFGCASDKSITITWPEHFNIQIPFQSDSKGIIISTFWGVNKKEYKLYLDNHSPSWVNDAVLKNNPSVLRSNNLLYKTTTADGKNIHGDVYMCDKINIGELSFKNVAFYNISNEANTGKIDGVIGENIMNLGIWKIDFSNNMITFASSMDSIQGLQDTEPVPATFTDKAIEIEVTLSKSIKKKFGLDIGYNGCMIIPANEFVPLTASGKQVFKMTKKVSTPAGADTIENSVIIDSMWIGNYYWGGLSGECIATNTIVKEKLIGMGFFKQFAFLVIDYRNKAVYLSRLRRIEIPVLE
ncbi:MAG: hypothetical protein ABJB86_10695 [Bacteroidota bacterium]